MGLAVTDLVERTDLAPSELRGHAAALEAAAGELASVLGDVGRCRALAWTARPQSRGFAYDGDGSPEFVAHLCVHKLQKTYRIVPRGASPLDLSSDEPLSSEAQPRFRGQYELVAQPVVHGRLEMRLLRWPDKKVLWSALRDSTIDIPCDERLILYNPSKYPGFTHPDILRLYLANIVRVQSRSPAVAARLGTADRWLVSEGSEDARTTRDLAVAAVSAFFPSLDAHIPVEGRISALLPAADDQVRVQLDIGASHGLVPGLRLEVWRPAPATEKVGQVEIVEVDSAKSEARLRKTVWPWRRRGEVPEVGDRVISWKRPLKPRRDPP